jgi:hypothetical protein
LILVFSSLFTVNLAYAQFWTEGFGVDGSGMCANQGTPANGIDFSGNGVWTMKKRLESKIYCQSSGKQ